MSQNRQLPWQQIGGFLSHQPLLGSILTPVLLLVVFLVTSAESVTLTLSMMTSGGQLSTSEAKKIFWSLTISSTATVLLFSGGLGGLQWMAIAAA